MVLCRTSRVIPSNLVDVWNSVKKTSLSRFFLAVVTVTSIATAANAQKSAHVQPVSAAAPPPSSVGFFPLSEIHRGMHGTAWTVFEGTKPEPMDLEILGILHGARGPHRDLILARLLGEKPEYTGVVAGMSGSPVYIDGKLAGALSYRIGQFTKEPIAGITPIAQMLEVRDLGDLRIAQAGSIRDGKSVADKASGNIQDAGQTITAMETPLMMSGFQPEAIRLWKQQMAGTGLDMISAGGGADGTSS